MAPTTRRLRRAASALVLVAGGVATAASNGPLLGPSVGATAGPFTLTLSSEAPDAEVPFSALLDAQAEVVDGSGEVGLSVELDPASLHGVSFSLTSEVTGESNQADIIDPSAQEQAWIGIEAFAGCTGETPCEEPFTARFTMLDEAAEGDLEVTWYVDGIVEVAIPEDEQPTGTLELTVEY